MTTRQWGYNSSPQTAAPLAARGIRATPTANCDDIRDVLATRRGPSNLPTPGRTSLPFADAGLRLAAVSASTETHRITAVALIGVSKAVNGCDKDRSADERGHSWLLVD
jgi:hypothetical protein